MLQIAAILWFLTHAIDVIIVIQISSILLRFVTFVILNFRRKLTDLLLPLLIRQTWYQFNTEMILKWENLIYMILYPLDYNFLLSLSEYQVTDTCPNYLFQVYHNELVLNLIFSVSEINLSKMLWSYRIQVQNVH